MSTPTPHRRKTHPAQTGYVYEYYFVEKRTPADIAGMEYLFAVSRDRKTSFEVSVLLRRDAVQAWATAHGRELTDTEQYAAAKLRLLKGFDEIIAMAQEGTALVVDAVVLDELLDPLELA